MRNGRRSVAKHLVVYLKRDEAMPYARFGFVVPKSVGGAVSRNLVKRRLRAIARDFIQLNKDPVQVVVRAMPGAAEIASSELRKEILTSLAAADRKRSK